MRLIAPFATIARELSIIRELYEAELAERNPPIIRRTEAPKSTDTEITYMDDKPRRKKTMLDKVFLGEEPDEEEDDDVLS